MIQYKGNGVLWQMAIKWSDLDANPAVSDADREAQTSYT